MIRLLNKNEYAGTIPLFVECFGDDPEFLREYYGNDGDILSGEIRDCLVFVKEDENGRILSMVHEKLVKAVYETRTTELPYLMCIGTAKDARHQGHMDDVLDFVFRYLLEEGRDFAFLVPVDRAIYTHLGFTNFWNFREEEGPLLYADEGLCTCAAKSLSGKAFQVPKKLLPT